MLFGVGTGGHGNGQDFEELMGVRVCTMDATLQVGE